MAIELVLMYWLMIFVVDLLKLIFGVKWHRKESWDIFGMLVVVIAVIVYSSKDYFI